MSALRSAVLCLATVWLGAVIVAGPLRAENKTELIRPGAAPIAIKGTIKGYDSIDYRFEATAGQAVKVVLQTKHGANYFNLLREGVEQAIFIGDIGGLTYEGQLPQSGAYLIRVYLMRSAARRNETAHYTLDVSLGGGQGAGEPNSPDFADGLSGGPDYWAVAEGADASDRTLRKQPNANAPGILSLHRGALLRNLGCKMETGVRWCSVEQVTGGKEKGWVIGRALEEGAPETAPALAVAPAPAVAPALPTKFDASAQLRCSAGTPPSLGLPPLDARCEVRVIRKGQSAELWILRPGSTTASRFLAFDRETFKTDDGSKATWLRSDDNWLVGIGGAEFYFIPDAIIFGG